MSDETINEWIDHDDDADAALEAVQEELAESRATVAAARAEIVSMKAEAAALRAALERAAAALSATADFVRSHGLGYHGTAIAIDRDADEARNAALAMPGEPTRDVTLVELLEAEAKHRLTGDCADHVQYARLRAAAARLREEMERARGTLCDGWLERVNNGPLAGPAPTEAARCGNKFRAFEHEFTCDRSPGHAGTCSSEADAGHPLNPKDRP